MNDSNRKHSALRYQLSAFEENALTLVESEFSRPGGIQSQ